MSTLQIDEDDQLFQFRHEAMATDLRVSLGGESQDYARQASQEIFARIDDVESKLSLYREASDVTRINLAEAGSRIKISADCSACLAVALKASLLTADRFYPFLGIESLRLKGNVPSYLRAVVDRSSRVDSAGPVLELDVGANWVHKLSAGSLLDLGGIGKGYALDVVRGILVDWEIPRAVLSFGGSTLLFYAEEAAAHWTGKLGSQPIEPFWNGAISSSGLGFQGEHIIGKSDEGVSLKWVRSFSRCSSAAMADAFSTGAMLMDRDEVENLLESETGLAIALETEKGHVMGDSFCSFGAR